MSTQGKNPAAKAYPKVSANTTRGIASNQGRTVTAQAGLKNVNAGPGPKTGNLGDAAKRRAFQTGKSQAANLADTINRAYGARKVEDYVNPKLEGISPDTKQRSRSR